MQFYKFQQESNQLRLSICFSFDQNQEDFYEFVTFNYSETNLDIRYPNSS